MKKISLIIFTCLVLNHALEAKELEKNNTPSWQLIWSDEFSGKQLDNTKWSFERNCFGGGNNELQCYTDKKDNVFVRDGKLHIVAKKESFSGSALFDDDPHYNPDDKSKTQAYTSGRIRTKNKGDWQYGRVEVRAKLPQGQGMWPAIWMLPTEWKYGAWPLSGEIDIMEAINTNTPAEGNKVYGTLHYGEQPPKNIHTGTSYSPATAIWKYYHNYILEWEPGEIRWYVDNKHYATQKNTGWFSGASNDKLAPFNEKFHLILNMAVGGDWPKNPDGKTKFPQEMLVDYVRIYRCTTDSGIGCETEVDPTIKPLEGQQKPL